VVRLRHCRAFDGKSIVFTFLCHAEEQQRARYPGPGPEQGQRGREPPPPLIARDPLALGTPTEGVKGVLRFSRMPLPPGRQDTPWPVVPAPAGRAASASPGRSCRCELGSAPREFTSTTIHQLSYLLSGISPNIRVAFCRCELASPPGSSHLQNARGAGSRELGLCACVIARSGDVSRPRATRPSRGGPWRGRGVRSALHL
jgi:hypothetical protein